MVWSPEPLTMKKPTTTTTMRLLNIGHLVFIDKLEIIRLIKEKDNSVKLRTRIDST